MMWSRLLLVKLFAQFGHEENSNMCHSNSLTRFWLSWLGAETEEATPAPSQPVAAPVTASVAAHAPPSQPAADSLLGDLLMDMGPTQPAAPPVQPAAGMEILCHLSFLSDVFSPSMVNRKMQKVTH